MAEKLNDPVRSADQHKLDHGNRITFRPLGWERRTDNRITFFPLTVKALETLLLEAGEAILRKKSQIVRVTNYNANKLLDMTGRKGYFKNIELANGQYLSLKTFKTPARPDKFAISLWLGNSPFKRTDIGKPCHKKLSVKAEELEILLEDVKIIFKKLKKNTSPIRRRSLNALSANKPMGDADKENRSPSRRLSSTTRRSSKGFRSSSPKLRATLSPREFSPRAAFQSPKWVWRSER